MKVHKNAVKLKYCCLAQCLHHTAAMKEVEVAKALDITPRRVRQLRRSHRAGSITCEELSNCQQKTSP